MKSILKSRYIKLFTWVLTATFFCTCLPVTAVAEQVRDYRESRPKPIIRTLKSGEMSKIIGSSFLRNGDAAGKLPWWQFDGDVNMAGNGNLHLEYTDASWSAPGFPMQLVRTYDSNSAEIGPFGRGWTHNHDLWVDTLQSSSYPNDDLFVIRRKLGTGSYIYLSLNADGTIVGPAFDPSEYETPEYDVKIQVTDKCEPGKAVPNVYWLKVTSQDGTVTEYGGPEIRDENDNIVSRYYLDGKAYIRSKTDRFNKTMTYYYEDGQSADVFTDTNGNGLRDLVWQEPWDDADDDGVADSGEYFDCNNNSQWDNDSGYPEELTTDHNGNGEYDGATLRLAMIEDAVGRSLNFEYEDTNEPMLLTKVWWEYDSTNHLNREFDYTYYSSTNSNEGARGNLYTTTDPANRTYTYTYTQPSAIDGYIQDYFVANPGMVLKIGYIQDFYEQWDKLGLVEDITDPLGLTTTYEYGLQAHFEYWHDEVETYRVWLGVVSRTTPHNGSGDCDLHYPAADCSETRDKDQDRNKAIFYTQRYLDGADITYSTVVYPKAGKSADFETNNGFCGGFYGTIPNESSVAYSPTYDINVIPDTGWDSPFASAQAFAFSSKHDGLNHAPLVNGGGYVDAYDSYYNAMDTGTDGMGSAQVCKDYGKDAWGNSVSDVEPQDHLVTTEKSVAGWVYGTYLSAMDIRETRYGSVNLDGSPRSTPYTVPPSLGGGTQNSYDQPTWTRQWRAVVEDEGLTTSEQRDVTSFYVDPSEPSLKRTAMTFYDSYGNAVVSYTAQQIQEHSQSGLPSDPYNPQQGEYEPAVRTFYSEFNGDGPGSYDPTNEFKSPLVIGNKPSKIISCPDGTNKFTKYIWHNDKGDIEWIVETQKNSPNPVYRKTHYTYSDKVGTIGQVDVYKVEGDFWSTSAVETHIKTIQFTSRNAVGQPIDIATTNHVDSQSGAVHYGYDAAGKTTLVEETIGSTVTTIETEYWPGGQTHKQITTDSDSDAVTVTYTYNEGSLLTTMTDDLSGTPEHTIKYTYLPHSSLVSRIDDSVDCTLGITESGVNDDVRVDYDYTWQQITSATLYRGNPGYVANDEYHHPKYVRVAQIDYDFRTANRLASVLNKVYTDNTAYENTNQAYDMLRYEYESATTSEGYDGAGNRKTCKVTNYQPFDDANRNGICDWDDQNQPEQFMPFGSTQYEEDGVIHTESYTYNSDSQLTGVNYGDGDTTSYGCDLLANIKTLSRNDTSKWSMTGCSVDGLNRLNDATWQSDGTPQTMSIVYDSDGNMTQTNAPSGTRNMTWDVFNRLTQAVKGSSTANFTYRPDGIRWSKQINTGNTRYYLYAGTSMIAEYEKNGEGRVVKTRHIPGMHGVTASVDVSSLIGTYVPSYDFYLYDGLGSVAGVVDKNGQMYDSLSDPSSLRYRSYDVYGAPRAGGGLSSSGYVGGTGHLEDAETGLVYMRARYYDPELGRFLSQDPGRNGVNWYAYCRANPTKYMDSSGKSPIGIGGTAYSAVMLTTQCMALADFLSAVMAGEDMERSWASFMSAYKSDPLDDATNGNGTEVSIALSLADWGIGMLTVASPIFGALATGISGFVAGVQAAILIYAYEIRVSYYLEQAFE